MKASRPPIPKIPNDMDLSSNNFYESVHEVLNFFSISFFLLLLCENQKIIKYLCTKHEFTC